MRKYIGTVITSIIVITLSVLGFVFNGFNLSQNQLDALLILGIICGSSILYCFVVGELAHNNSQMDKLWSILPIAYTWVIAAKGGMSPRLIIYAVIATLWGIRLTFNFARKGAYRLKFWTGEEDYRWAILRKNKILKNKFAWAVWDLLFISGYQNLLVLVMVFPALAAMDSTASLGVFDFLGAGLALMFLTLETITDEQQWRFHKEKKRLLKEGKKLEELPAPYNKGFNTTGIWGYARHANYLGEQGIWVSLYLMVIGSGMVTYNFFSWSIFGPLFLVFLFLGSSAFGEAISSSKYPEYKYYVTYVSKYVPLWKYDEAKAKAKYEKNN